jgi:hypothetical protein
MHTRARAEGLARLLLGVLLDSRVPQTALHEDYDHGQRRQERQTAQGGQ